MILNVVLCISGLYQKTVSSCVNITSCKDRRKCFDSFQDLNITFSTQIVISNPPVTKSCVMSIRLSKNLWHFSVIVSFKVIFYFHNYQNTPDMSSQRVSCVVGKLLCARGKHRVFSKNRINTEVKRRILSCWDIGPDFSEWL